MGGTTAKAGAIVDGIAQVAGEFEAAGRTHSGRSVKGSGYPVRFPFVDLAEVSAGGGTIAWIDDAGALRVGPVSAGADPGPACYGAGDRATVTDANVVLGRLNPLHLLGGAFPIEAGRARAAVESIALQIGMGVEEAAAGIVTLVDAQMAKVLRIVTIERGLDPREFTLAAFGGGGPLHACALAGELGVARVLIPHRPGIFSAQGLLGRGFARALRRTRCCDRRAMPISATRSAPSRPSNVARARRARARKAPIRRRSRFRREYDARYAGQSFELTIAHAASAPEIAANFHREHRARYGYDGSRRSGRIGQRAADRDRRQLGAGSPIRRRPAGRAPKTPAVAGATPDLDGHGVSAAAPVYERARFAGGRARWRPCDRRAVRHVHVRRARLDGRSATTTCSCSSGSVRMSAIDPITVEVIASALVYASEEMGIAVRNSAYSPNIKERLDHSCALFDARGRLIAQAEHIPVHLGSLPWGLRADAASRRARVRRHARRRHVGRQRSVRLRHALQRRHRRASDLPRRHARRIRRQQGAPCRRRRQRCPDRCRPTPRDLFAEGLVVPPMRLVENDESVDATVALFRANSRTPDARSGDLRAQTAGNYTGERRLLELCERYGLETFNAAVERLIDDSEVRMRAALRSLGNGTFESADYLEDRKGEPTIRICLRLALRDGSARLDYSGTAASSRLPAQRRVRRDAFRRALRAAGGRPIRRFR